MKGIGLSLLVFGGVTSKSIFSIMEESIEASIFGESETRAYFMAVHLNNRLVIPLTGIENPAHQHLFGIGIAIMTLAVYFLCKVDGQCLERANTIVIIDKKVAKACCCRFIDSSCSA